MKKQIKVSITQTVTYYEYRDGTTCRINKSDWDGSTGHVFDVEEEIDFYFKTIEVEDEEEDSDE